MRGQASPARASPRTAGLFESRTRTGPAQPFPGRERSLSRGVPQVRLTHEQKGVLAEPVWIALAVPCRLDDALCQLLPCLLDRAVRTVADAALFEAVPRILERGNEDSNFLGLEHVTSVPFDQFQH